MANNIPIVLLQQAQQPQQPQQAQQPQAGTQNSGSFLSLFSDVSQLFANASNYFKQNAAAANTPQTIIMAQGGGSIFGNCGRPCSCGNNLFGINYQDDALYDYFSVDTPRSSSPVSSYTSIATQKSSSPAIGYTSSSSRTPRIFDADNINRKVQEALDSVDEADAAAAAAKQQQATGTTPAAGTTTPATTAATTPAATAKAQTPAPAEGENQDNTNPLAELQDKINNILGSGDDKNNIVMTLNRLIGDFPDGKDLINDAIKKLQTPSTEQAQA